MDQIKSLARRYAEVAMHDWPDGYELIRDGVLEVAAKAVALALADVYRGQHVGQ
jgi:hypothetical protein